MLNIYKALMELPKIPEMDFFPLPEKPAPSTSLPELPINDSPDTVTVATTLKCVHSTMDDTCCECGTNASIRCAQCALAYCKACSESVHAFAALKMHSPVSDAQEVIFSTKPLPPLERLLPPATQEVRLIMKYFSSDKIMAFQSGRLHHVRQSGLPSPNFANYHLLYDHFYSKMNSKGFQDLQKQVDGMVCAAETRLEVDNAFSYILDTLNSREKELCASVRDACKTMRNDGVLGRVKAEERSYARVLRANQWFVHSLLALVRAEVTKRRELPHFLMEDVAEMLHLSRNLFFPHELIN